jgi:hypothetical protein
MHLKEVHLTLPPVRFTLRQVRPYYPDDGRWDFEIEAQSPIKNIYRRDTSMVPRLLLTAARFRSVQEILTEGTRRNLVVQRADALAMSMWTVRASHFSMDGQRNFELLRNYGASR